MYVCVCMAVTESEVRDAIEQGATTVQGVTRACRAGGDCGACQGMIATMIEDHLEEAHGSEQLLPETALVRTRAA